MPGSVTNQDKIDKLKQDSNIQDALDQTAAAKETARIPGGGKHKLKLGSYFVLLLALSGLYYLLRLRLFQSGATYYPFLQRLLVGAMATVIAFGLAQTLDIYLIARVRDAASQYTVRRVVKLMTALVIALIFISILFANWYTAIVSLGLVSLILGFALQTPITSFIAWIYIIIRTPYRVGDRIKIGDASGDVIDLGYLDTTLWEFGGDYLSTDHPSGRIIKFPNSNVLSSAVYNYSWPLFPYIWNEIKFYVAYESDLQFVSETMRRIAEEEIGEPMLERVRTFRALLSETPVDQVEVREHPSVSFRVSDNTWVEAIVRYLVEPKQAGRVKSKLIEQMLHALNASPDKVLFPRGPAR
ncbi:MAG: mechanosensitive ion channel family protein [Pyrinomonadaceae bacterium]